jgi:CO dehydrogenase/acetyl-CoA synthase beta subunit
MFGNKLRVPAEILKELDEAGLKHRFVSIKKIQDSGGYHPMGWTPYTLKNPKKNPITGNMEDTLRVGDLILAVKSAQDHTKHLNWLNQKAKAQSANHKANVSEMKKRISEGGASKHVSLIEGFEENESDD